MLQNLRDNSKGVISGLLIGFLVIIFAISGSEALFSTDGSVKDVITVNGESISEVDIARASANYKQQLSARYGDALPAGYLSDENVRQPVIENLIQRKVMVSAALDAGLVIGDDHLNQQIISTPQFQKADGTFDAILYQQLLRTIGFTPSTYKKALSEDTIINQLTAGIVDSGFVTPAELQRIAGLTFQTRDFTYGIIPAEKIAETVSVEAAEVDSFYQANAQAFTNPEQVAVDYIDLNVTDLMAGIDISEEQVRDQHQQNLASFVAAPEREAAHILIDDNDAARVAEVAEKLAAGEDFAELARTYSDDLGTRDQGGELGFTSGDTFPKAFEDELQSLEVGAVSAPVKTDAGTHFIKLLSERGVKPSNFEETRTQIAEQLKRAEAESRFVTLLEKLRDLSYNAESLVDVAQEIGLESKNTGLFSRNSGSGISAEAEFVTAAFSEEVLEHNNSSDLIELAPDRVVVVKKTEHKPSYIRPLEEVRDQIVETLREQKTRDLLAQKGQELIAEIKSGATLEAVAQTAGYEVKTILKADRNKVDVDNQLLRKVFSMPKPQSEKPVVDGILTRDGSYAVIELTEVNLGGEELAAEEMAGVAAQLTRISGENEYRSYQNLLREKASIKE